MAPKKPKATVSTPKVPESSKSRLGIAPTAVTKKAVTENANRWCPVTNLDLDPACDPLNPRAIAKKDVDSVMPELRKRLEKTELMKSNRCDIFGVQLYYKIETGHETGSVAERGALGALMNLKYEQLQLGVVTASLGNFGLALAYLSKKFDVKPRIVYPSTVQKIFIDKCKEYGARVIVSGNNFNEARHEALVLANDLGCTYISGYDHPGAIAGKGTVALEILEDLPETDAILVPIGGGGLIAGISAVAKAINPNILIYGIEPDKSCCFYKAMEKEGIYETESKAGIADMLGIPLAGCNSYHTAKSYINKMVLVDDDWIARAIAFFAEEEKMLVDGPGATAMSALFAMPAVLPELRDKNVVCVMTGSNISLPELIRSIERAKAIEGRLIKVSLKMTADLPDLQKHVFSMLANTDSNILNTYVDHSWITESDVNRVKFQLTIATHGLEHACQLKRVMTTLFPNMCEFEEEPFSPIPVCACYPKKRNVH